MMNLIHRSTILFGLTLLLPAGFAGRASAREEGNMATIRVRLQEEKAPVPAALYGIFMEEISHAFDGGIYAELIRNRSFEEGVLPPGMKPVKKDDGGLKMELEKLPPGVPEENWNMPWPWNGNCGWDPNRALIGWSLQNEGGAQGEMKITEANPMKAVSTRSLEMTIAPPAEAEGRVALVNSGYWGINVQAGTSYELRFHLRPGAYEGELAATLETKDGKILASHKFDAVTPGESWQEYTATLEATDTDPEGRFVLSFRGKGTLQVDWVSLFPPTYKDRPNGLRPDLAKYLEDLKPNFVRYPGGCYVEGLSFESAPDWRKMVCPPEERPGMWGYWQYRSTDGFGYHEFLQFCEDIGADAMYVSFAGMTVHPENNWPIEDLDSVIQRTLDAIEYAVGPVDSKWGAERAKMDHPRPFPLRYVEIGNEHPPALYGDYYKKFRDAIKARYPWMTVIMSMYWSGLNREAIARAGDDNIDIVDQHAYLGSGWARSNFGYFDRYERKPWKVYLGEYAHHHGDGDWSAAMDDSVFLMMMERNGDLVKMASYAPLFCNVNSKNWGVNLIEFDASRSFAHASYYVQKVFNENRPDVNLATSVDEQPKFDPNLPLMGGKFGLGSWNTHVEFKEVRIYDEKDKLIYSDDFKTLRKWETPGVGRWRVKKGVLQQTDKGQSPAMLLLKKPEVKIGRVTVKARRVEGEEGFLMFFNAGGIDRFLFCNYGAGGNRFSAIQERGTPEGCSFRGGRGTEGAIETDRWYDLSLVLGRDRAEMYLDGVRVSRARAEYLPSFFATAGYNRADKTVVLKATNYRSEPVRAEIQLDGAAEIGKNGQHIVIRSEGQYDENTLDNPRRIVPQEEPLPGCSERFSVLLPPYSVNLLRIPAEKPMRNAIPDVAVPIPLSAVRLTGGPLKKAQDLDAQYLLALEPDRMLAYYRRCAGLEQKAELYDGWDGGGRNLTGHIAGHYLSAVSLMYASTGDERFKERADYVVKEFKEIQDKNGDGYLSALEGGRECWEAVARGNIRSGGFDLNGLWAPWYVLHKTYAGLRDAYRFTGNRDALDIEIKFAEWAEGIVSGLTDAEVQRMLNTEFGGMNEVLVDLYADTGDKRWLNLSYYFEHRSIIEPLMRHQDILAGKHGNTQVPKLIGSLDRFIATGNAGDLMAASFFWDQVAQHHSFATGGHGKDEYFGEPDKLSDRVDGRTAETCNVYNMLKLTRRLFGLRPDVYYADFHERALFNHILASIDPEDGRTCYMVPVGRGVRHEYADMFGSFTCCVGTGMESHALHGDGIYYVAGDKKMWVNLYAPSTADWAAAGVKLEMDTDFPEGESATLKMTLQSPKEFTLFLRRPHWVGDGFSIKLNGEAFNERVVDSYRGVSPFGRQGGDRGPGGSERESQRSSSYVELKRTWKSGDTVVLALPKTLRLEPVPDNPRVAAILWGPLVLAGDLGPEPERERGRDAFFERPNVPVFVAAERPVAEWLKPVPDKPGQFRTDGVGYVIEGGDRESDVDLVPFYRLHRRTYSVYWDLFSQSEWEEKKAEYAAEQERKRKLEAATVAYAQPGEMQPERDYNYQGPDDTRVMRVMGRAGRRGRSWFSFDLPVEPEHPMALVVTYFSGERQRGPATFEILVDGERVGEQTVERTTPPAFFDVEYALPEALVKDKQKVIVRFQAANQSSIATVFGIRMIRADAER